MPVTRVSPEIDLAYETFGSPTDPAILLIAGFGAQLLSWHEDLCRMLASNDRFIIRFDNRDCGLSTKLDTWPVDFEKVITAATSGNTTQTRALAPYTLSDMATDSMELLSTLGIERAHLVGASLGGMIAQLAASLFPQRVVSLTSMMSSTGEAGYGDSTPEAQAALFGPPAESKQDFIVASVANSRRWGSRRYFDAEAANVLASDSYDRCHRPQGTKRQLAALLATGWTAPQLRELTVPTLVIHGLDDTLVAPSGGKRTAELIADSDLLLVEDMGHDRPEPLWPLLTDAIISHTS